MHPLPSFSGMPLIPSSLCVNTCLGNGSNVRWLVLTHWNLWLYSFRTKIKIKPNCIVAILEMETTVFFHTQHSYSQIILFHYFSAYLPLVDIQAFSDRTQLIVFLCPLSIPYKMSLFVILPASGCFPSFYFRELSRSLWWC